jgi:hypothetical protein
MGTGLIWWLLFMLFFLVTPVGYGWGYRRWGPPYPRFIQHRRWQRAGSMGDSRTSFHHSWGLAGDIMWMLFLIGLFWFATAFWWR